jgi:hypothetical protein
MLIKAKTQAEIETALRATIARAEAIVQIAGVIREAARKQEGKQPTKRFANAVQARLDELMGEGVRTHWESDDWGCKITIWGSASTHPSVPQYNDRAVFNVARKSKVYLKDCQETISETWIVDHNQSFFLDVERLPKYREALEGGYAKEWAEVLKEIDWLGALVAEEANRFGVGYLLAL